MGPLIDRVNHNEQPRFHIELSYKGYNNEINNELQGNFMYIFMLPMVVCLYFTGFIQLISEK